MFKELFFICDNSINLTNYDFTECNLHFDIEDAAEVSCHIDDEERNYFNALYQKDQLDYVNTILWKFLQLNPITKHKLDICDHIISFISNHKNDLSEFEIDTFINEKSNYKSFKSFKKNLLDLHQINFDDYKAFKQNTLQQFYEQQYIDSSPHVTPIVYAYPRLKNLTQTIFVEAHPYMSKDRVQAYIEMSKQTTKKMFMEKLYSTHRIRLLYDAFILYKYYFDLQVHYLEEKNNPNRTTKLKFRGYERAKRIYNFHILQKFGFSFIPIYEQKNDKTPKNRENKAVIAVSKIETNQKLVLTNHKFIDRKRVLSVVEKFLHLGKIGI